MSLSMWCLCCIPAHAMELLTGQKKDGVIIAEYQCPHSGKIFDYREEKGVRQLTTYQESISMPMYRGQRQQK